METEETKTDVELDESQAATPTDGEPTQPTQATADSAAAEAVAEDPAAPKYKGIAAKFDNFFGISKAKSTFRKEIVGGLVTFMAMVYILPVNAGMLSATGVSYGAIYIATALSAVVGTILMSLLARLPMAQASGMGLNAFFTYTLCLGFGLSYANSLVLVLIDGIVFILLP